MVSYDIFKICLQNAVQDAQNSKMVHMGAGNQKKEAPVNLEDYKDNQSDIVKIQSHFRGRQARKQIATGKYYQSIHSLLTFSELLL